MPGFRLKNALDKNKAAIEKEFRRKIYIETHKKKFVWMFKMGVIGFIILVCLIIFAYIIWRVFIKKPPIPEQPSEMPSASFVVPKEVGFVLSNQKDTYDVFAKIENTDPDWGASILNYKFILKDDAGNIVGERKRQTYVLPGKEKFIIEISVEATSQVRKVEMELDPQKVQKMKELPKIDIQVKNVNHQMVRDKSKVSGTLVNNSSYNYDVVDVNVVLYNDLGKVVGLNYTNVGAFLSGKDRDFSVSWDKAIIGVSNVVVEPNVNVFKTGTFMKEYKIGEEKFLEY